VAEREAVLREVVAAPGSFEAILLVMEIAKAA
jgi:hypothetical protein